MTDTDTTKDPDTAKDTGTVGAASTHDAEPLNCPRCHGTRFVVRSIPRSTLGGGTSYSESLTPCVCGATRPLNKVEAK